MITLRDTKSILERLYNDDENIWVSAQADAIDLIEKMETRITELETNCSNVIQANIEVAQLNVAFQERIDFMEKKIDELNTPMPCGHLARYAVNEKEGTQYCALCDRNAQMIVLETVADVLNKTVTCMQLLREVDDRVPGLLFDHYDVNSISLGVRINNAIIELDKANNQ